MTEVLVDPGQAFLDAATLTPPAVLDHDHVAAEIGAAVLTMALLIRRKLGARDVDADDVAFPEMKAHDAWAELAPTWLRLAVPAIRHAYALGRVDGLTEEELNALATDYAGTLGDYVNVTSAEAFADGMNAQLAQRWSPQLALHRASAAYGLDRQQMRGYVRSLASSRDSPDPIPLAAKALVDKAMLTRANRIGDQETYSAAQAGQSIAWIWMERTGRLPEGCQREWELGANEQHCATCLELARQRVPLAEPFLFLNGVKIWAPRAHLGCYCRVRLVLPEVAKAADVSVAGICVRAKDTKRVLMLQRAADPKDPAGGMWEFPGGHLEAGESPLAGGKREWAEEVRRRLPATTQVGTWRNGIYQGFVLEIPHEHAIPSHKRGRVANPDDPDGDQVEAIAWWDPAHLAGNPAVRPELRASVPKLQAALRGEIAKYDPKERRDATGRWTVTETREPEPVTVEPASPFSAPDSPFRSTPFKNASPFLGPSPFSAPKPIVRQTSRLPFLSQRSIVRAPKPANLSTRRVLLIPGKYAPPPPQPAPKPPEEEFFLPADHFHELTQRNPLGAHYDLGDVVSFDQAASRPVASSVGTAWSMLSDDQVFANRVPPGMDRNTLERDWKKILRAALPGHEEALNNPAVIDRLSASDLEAIFTLGGYDTGQGVQEQRDYIYDAVNRVDQGHEDSLAMAYADFAVWHDPKRLLGTSIGGPIQDALDDAEDDRLDVREMLDHPIPVEQVFEFTYGHHPDTLVDKGEAYLRGDHVARHHSYRSALHDMGAGTPPLRFGLRLTGMSPYTEDDVQGPGD